MNKIAELKKRITGAVEHTMKCSVHPTVASSIISDAIMDIGCTSKDVKAVAHELEAEIPGAEKYVMSFVR